MHVTGPPKKELHFRSCKLVLLSFSIRFGEVMLDDGRALPSIVMLLYSFILVCHVTCGQILDTL